MKNFLKIKNSKPGRKATFGLAAVCLIALFIGISSNEKGLLLDYLAAAVLILAFVHTWRKTKYFLILLGASLLGFPLFAVLHNVFYGLGLMAKDIIVLSHSLEFLHVVFFVLAVVFCPAGILIGAAGSILMYLKKRNVPV